MNTLKALLLTAALTCAPCVFAEDTPPVLPFLKAAQIAQETLEGQNLPKEYFLRSLSLVYPRDGGPIEKYEARFEPVIRERRMVGSEPPTTPIKYKAIIITMEGVATIEEKIINRPEPGRSIIRRGAESSPSPVRE